LFKIADEFNCKYEEKSRKSAKKVSGSVFESFTDQNEDDFKGNEEVRPNILFMNSNC